ncbi:hypothetical protein ABN702_05440 [Bacillus haimaensis]|uniref:hypothetical protein n=1 Tax=Bacillus haimaensis TaxID=3160967 RepID=UPI003AA8F245
MNNMMEFKKSQEEMKKELIDLNEKTSTLSENQRQMNKELCGLNKKTFLLSVGQHQIKEELHSLTNTTFTLWEEFYLFRHGAIEWFNEISSTLRIEEDQTKDIEAILEEISVKLDEKGSK